MREGFPANFHVSLHITSFCDRLACDFDPFGSIKKTHMGCLNVLGSPPDFVIRRFLFYVSFNFLVQWIAFRSGRLLDLGGHSMHKKWRAMGRDFAFHLVFISYCVARGNALLWLCYGFV